MGLDATGAERWEREHPYWPGHATVVRYHGSWAGALHAAGLAPAPPARDLSLQERIESARRLHADRWSTREIADLLGVSARTVRQYLAAQPCTDCGTLVVKSSSGRCRACVTAARPPATWTQPSVLEALELWEAETGRQPTPTDWGDRRAAGDKWHREHPASPSHGQVVRLFGSWRSLHGRLPTAREWTRRAADHPRGAELRIVERGDTGGDRADLTDGTPWVPMVRSSSLLRRGTSESRRPQSA
jgi:hypothetical protein